MDLSAHDSLALLGLIAALTALLVLASAMRVPYPVLLVLGGLGLGFVPGVPRLALPPELVLVAFLPPLLYAAAFFTPLREFRRNIRPISLLATGLVLATTVAVAAVAHAAIPDLSWPAAFVLGAIVSPTDPIAVTSVGRRLGIPRRLVAVIEGESLINDATALVLYRFAVAAALTGTFSLAGAGLRFVASVAGGVAMGLAVGWIVRQVRRRLDNPPVEIAISLATGYFAYLPAEAAGVSAVLAAVAAGIYLGWHAPELTTVRQRLQGFAVWETVVFVLEALLFILIGLQLPVIIDGLSGWSAPSLIGYAALVSATVIAVRFLWIFVTAPLPRGASPCDRERAPYSEWRQAALLSWSGMRGGVSLAAALALPLTTEAGAPFPERELIVFLTFAAILVTLLVQGLTLPRVIRRLGLHDDGLEAEEEARARLGAAEAALERLGQLSDESWVHREALERLRGLYQFRRTRFRTRLDPDGDGAIEERSRNYQRLYAELLEAERRRLLELRREGHIDDDVMLRIQRDLDLEQSRLDLAVGSPVSGQAREGSS